MIYRVQKFSILIQAVLLFFSGLPIHSCEAEESARIPLPMPSKPFPYHANYRNGTIFPNQFTQEEMDGHIRDYYDYWKLNYLVEVSPGRYRVALGKLGTMQGGVDQYTITVSEGQGYGMMIIPIMASYEEDARDIFDGMWLFVRDHPSPIDPRLMAFKPDPSDSTDGGSAAFDGDADIAYGLLLAHRQWGSDGAINYLSEAETLILAIYESMVHPVTFLPKLGDWVLNDPPANDPIRTGYSYSTRPSDFMLSNFRAFAKVSKDFQVKWKKVEKAVIRLLKRMQQRYSPGVGLLPDFIVDTNGIPKPAAAGFLEGATDGYYYYNSARVPWRLGLNSVMQRSGKVREQVVMNSMAIEQLASGNASAINPGYMLDGTPLTSFYTTAIFVSPFGVAAMNGPNQSWLNDIYGAVYQSQENYFEDTVNLLCLLVMTGNFWDPYLDL